MIQIQIGNTIVVHYENGTLGFFWLCIDRADGYVFFSWYGNPRRATIADYWEVSKNWFATKVEDGTVEVYESLPIDKYGDVFEQQADTKNR